MTTQCRRVGCECCPTEAYCKAAATTTVTIRLPHAHPHTTRVCGTCHTTLTRTPSPHTP